MRKITLPTIAAPNIAKRFFRHSRLKGAVLCAVLALLLGGCVSLPIETQEQAAANVDGMLTVHFIDVGQGDCTFVELPDGESLLIDAGNPGDADEIIEYITDTGCKTLDYVIATHPHSDHIGGMAEVINSFDVKRVYMPNVAHTSRAFERLLDAVEESGAEVIEAKSGVELLNSGGLKMALLSPVREKYSELNDYSAVLKITFGETSFLFMGDAEKLPEDDILASGADVKANVLKCGHHGSAYSSGQKFIYAVMPEYAVISCGEGNMYGHPHRETLDILNKIGAKIYRTDTDGTVVITSDGQKITDKNTLSE